MLLTWGDSMDKLCDISGNSLKKRDMPGIAVAGNIVVDIVNTIDAYPERSMLANVLATERSVGGCVPNVGIALAKMDPELSISAVGMVGDDDNGSFVMLQMEEYGVDVSAVRVSEKYPTGCTYVMSDLKSGERTFFYVGGANNALDIDNIDITALNCKIFHIGYALLLDALDSEDPEYGTRLARLLRTVRERGIKTSLDAISSEKDNYAEKVKASLPHCDYLIVNEIECGMIAGVEPRYDDGGLNVDNIRTAMEKLIDWGVKDRVIIHTSEAGFMLTRDKKRTFVPSLVLPDGFIKGKVGAGDAYAAGCLYALYKGYDDRHVLEFASCAAAMSLSEPDSVSGIRQKNEIEALGKLYPRSDLA